MRRILAFAAILGLAAALGLPPGHAAAATGTTRTYAMLTCFVDWSHPYWRPAGLNGQTEHDGAVITNAMYVNDGSGWVNAGYEVDTVRDESNSRAGTEIFRGSFELTSGALGDFTGSFVWLENGGGARGYSVGRSTTGALWKADLGVLDPAPYAPLPACAADNEVSKLAAVEIVTL